MDLDYDWAEHDAKKVDKSKPMKTKVAKAKASSNTKRGQCGPLVKKTSLKKPAAKSVKTRSKKSSESAPMKSRAVSKKDSLQMTLG